MLLVEEPIPLRAPVAQGGPLEPWLHPPHLSGCALQYFLGRETEAVRLGSSEPGCSELTLGVWSDTLDPSCDWGV